VAYTIEGFLTRIQGDQNNSHRDPTGSHKETLEQVRHRARHTFTALAETVAKVQAKTSLSEVGKRAQVAEEAKQTDLSGITRPRAANQATIAQLRGRLFSIPKSDYEPAEARAREREIRDEFKAKPFPERQAAYAAAMKAGHYEVVRAFTQGPLGSLVDTEFRQRIETEHAKTTQPAVFENYEQAQNLEEHLSSLELHARDVLRDLGVV